MSYHLRQLTILYAPSLFLQRSVRTMYNACAQIADLTDLLLKTVQLGKSSMMNSKRVKCRRANVRQQFVGMYTLYIRSSLANNTFHIYIYINIYIHVCMCVCVCVTNSRLCSRNNKNEKD